MNTLNPDTSSSDSITISIELWRIIAHELRVGNDGLLYGVSGIGQRLTGAQLDELYRLGAHDARSRLVGFFDGPRVPTSRTITPTPPRSWRAGDPHPPFAGDDTICDPR